ncbi:MAG TPA: dihydropteroate synthase [Rickettsia endosymbiont of Bembidion lapponicum]|nr:dihydropteroate synthase [Rickettsia endosymbiont of Bembidion lapponicum]
MIYISIGSNLGNRLLNIKKALNLLKNHGFVLIKQSIIFETQAILPSNANSSWDKPYFNMVVQGTTALLPNALLTVLKKIEQQIGRKENYDKWCPRVIDLDILLWDSYHLDLPDLKIPHSQLLNRPFLIHLIASLSIECRYICPNNNLYNDKTFAEIAHLIENQGVIRSLILNPQFVGILNITPDSFSDGGLSFHKEDAVKNFVHLMDAGSSMIDLGAQSTRPSAFMISEDEEYTRLDSVLEELKGVIEKTEALISIDSFSPEVIKRILKKYPVHCINLVKTNLDNDTLRLIADYNCKIVIMHSLTVPPQKQQCLDFDKSPIISLNIWAEQEIAKLEKCGFDRKDIIFDPGIGFGKSVYQNLHILQNIQEFKKLECEILVGHSRKSYISTFYNSIAKERDLETIAISKYLAENGVNYLRVHNVEDHQRFFAAKQIVKTLV